MHGYQGEAMLESNWHWGCSVAMEGSAMYDITWN
jgi:hypothetical protein